MEAKREQLLAKLAERHNKKSAVNGTSSSSNITGSGDNGTANDHFYFECASIIDELEQLRTTTTTAAKGSIELKLNDVAGRISKLQSTLNGFVAATAYERRKAATKLQDVQEKLKRVRAEFQPRQSFAFAKLKSPPISEKKTSGTTRNENGGGGGSACEDMADGDIGPHRSPGRRADLLASFTSTSSVVIKDRLDEPESINIQRADCEGKDVRLVDCRSCTIRLLGNSTTVHATGLVDCTILTYPVSTSIFIENCHRCVFVVACQQLRMHSSVQCDVYLHVTTRAIIEQCERLAFAPYLAAVLSPKEDIDNDESLLLFDKSGLNMSENHWDEIQDFNWLVSVGSSPNWNILPSDKRLKFAIIGTPPRI